MSEPPRSRQRPQPTQAGNQTAQQRRDAVARRLKSLAAEDAVTAAGGERDGEANDRTLVHRRESQPVLRPASYPVSRAGSGVRPVVRPVSRAGQGGQQSVGARVEAVRGWVSEHRHSLLVGFGGLVAGVILACLFLALLAPQPEAVRSTGSGAGADGTATLDDTYLTDLLADALVQANLPIGVSNVQAHAKAGNEIEVSGDMAEVLTLPGQSSRRLTTTLQLSVADGALHAHIASIDFGGLSLPGLVTGALESEINAHLALPALTQPGGHRYVVTGVTTKDGSITMTLKRS